MAKAVGIDLGTTNSAIAFMEADRPEVIVNAEGGVRVGGGYDKQLVGDEVLRKAVEACKPYQVVMPPDVMAQKLAGAREVAQCMRAHGVESYPDPDPNDLSRSLPDAVRDDPEYDQAKEICDTRRPSPSANPS